MPGATPGLDPTQVQKAAAALLKFVGSQQQESKELFTDDEIFYLVGPWCTRLPHACTTGSSTSTTSQYVECGSAAHLIEVNLSRPQEQQACRPVSLRHHKPQPLHQEFTGQHRRNFGWLSHAVQPWHGRYAPLIGLKNPTLDQYPRAHMGHIGCLIVSKHITKTMCINFLADLADIQKLTSM